LQNPTVNYLSPKKPKEVYKSDKQLILYKNDKQLIIYNGQKERLKLKKEKQIIVHGIVFNIFSDYLSIDYSIDSYQNTYDSIEKNHKRFA